MKSKFSLSVAASIIVLAGCSSSDEKIHPTAPYSREYINQQSEVKRDTTTTWSKERVHGAAIEQGSYADVLGKRKTEKIEYPVPPVETSSPSDAASLLTNPTEHALNNAGVSYTIYEKSRWNRFCGAGKMDKRDIAFVLKEGTQNIPEEFIGTCKKPTWPLSQYEHAWTKKCESMPLSSIESEIIRQTIQPFKCEKN